jgi:hypothetical protein
MEAYQEKGIVCVCFFWEEKEGVRKKKGISSYVEKKVLFMREMCARIKHGRISMTKPLEFYFK